MWCSHSPSWTPSHQLSSSCRCWGSLKADPYPHWTESSAERRRRLESKREGRRGGARVRVRSGGREEGKGWWWGERDCINHVGLISCRDECDGISGSIDRPTRWGARTRKNTLRFLYDNRGGRGTVGTLWARKRITVYTTLAETKTKFKKVNRMLTTNTLQSYILNFFSTFPTSSMQANVKQPVSLTGH